jgi:transcriptional regulator with XRE-family HTH domain
MPGIRKLLRRTYSPNQVVALNVARARAMRGWTQEQAAGALEPYLGARWSSASFSAVERSIAGTRVKQFSADELVALARGFDVPIGWFFLPPPPAEDAGLATADAKAKGTDMDVLLDVVLGTDASTPPWRAALAAYAAATAKKPGTVDDRLGGLAEMRAAAEVRKAFGDVAEARDVLLRLAGLIDRLDANESTKPAHTTAQSDTTSERTRRRGS